MYDPGGPEAELGRAAEQELEAMLITSGHSVVPMRSMLRNTRYTNAPMMRSSDGLRVLPDLFCFKGDAHFWVEVKSCRHPARLTVTLPGQEALWVHQILLERWNDYRGIAGSTRVPLWIAIFERRSPFRPPPLTGDPADACRRPGGWLVIDVHDAAKHGREARHQTVSGKDAWEWDRRHMSPLPENWIAKGAGSAPQIGLPSPERSVPAARPGAATVWPIQPEPPMYAAEPIPPMYVAEPPILPMGMQIAPLEVPPLEKPIPAVSPSEKAPPLEKPIPTPASAASAAHEEGGPLHSVLISGRVFDPEEAERYLRRGIKVAWMTAPVQLPARLEVFAHSRVRLLTLHPDAGVPLELVDGRRDGAEPEAAVLDRLVAKSCPPGLTAFNPEQYRIEHGAPGTDLLAMAGAGTGKTHVMVERILYLLATVPGLEPRHIAMITFTRDATREMRERIVRTLSLRLRLTGREDFRRWVFGLSSMRINTFHAFGKHLLERHGSLLGLPQELELRGLRRQRQRHILEGLDGAIRKHGLMDHLLKTFHRHPLYEVEDAMDRIWARLENIGVRATGPLDWGIAAPEHAALNAVLAEALTSAAQRHEQWKQTEGAIGLNDLTRHLPVLAKELGKWREPIRFLFVDEFQDTDNVQIDAICSIKRATGAGLFVVGDVKQSVYRFRGAEHTAFSRLKTELKKASLPEPLTLPLQRNYRTAPEILDPLHRAFTAWGKRGLLPYGAQDRLLPCMKPGGRLAVQHGTSVAEMIREMSPGGTRVLLVRTNREALDSQQAAKAAGHPCDVERGGSFFRTEAVRDMAVLLRALLHPREPVALAAWLCSPWCSGRVPWSVLAEGWGEPAALPDRIGALFGEDKGPGSFLWLQKAARDLRDWPLLTVLRRMMHEMDPASRRMKDSAGEPEDRIEALRYLNHLDQLFTLLHEKFDKDFLALPMLDAWLRQHMTTDGETDEDAQEVVPGRLKAITVHRAKGLEWDAVALPSTARSFTAAAGFQVHVEPGGAIPRIGWTWRSGGSAESAPQNSHWNSLNAEEERETRMEETRLLYVALTRSRRELLVNIEPSMSKKQDNSWSTLLKDLP